MNKSVIAIFFFVLTLGGYAQKKDFYGSNFTVKYPANFTAEGSMPSANNDDTFVSAIFTSPDKKVSFYIYSPNTPALPTDITIKEGFGELLASSGKKKSKNKVYATSFYEPKDGFTHSYLITCDENDRVTKVVGRRYKTIKDLNASDKLYDEFKKSFQNNN